MPQSVRFAILWKRAPKSGRLEIAYGKLGTTRIVGKGKFKNGEFVFSGDVDGRIEVAVDAAQVQIGAFATRVTVHTQSQPFTFFLRDVRADTPIFVPAYGVVVIPADDGRTYEQVETGVRGKGLVSDQQGIDAAPEETFASASAATRNLKCPTWLALSRDMRLFSVGFDRERPWGYWGYVEPRYHSHTQALPETKNQPMIIGFAIGRGSACVEDITRGLDDGVLPILRSIQRDGEVEYHLTAFCTLEKEPITLRKLRGTDYRAATAFMGGLPLSAEEREKIIAKWDKTEIRGVDQETVCAMRFEAINRARVPRYAYFKSAQCQLGGPIDSQKLDPKTGFMALSETGRVFAVQRLGGRPLAQEETAVLLQPGASITFEMLFPHQPLPPERAVELAKQDFDEHLAAAREFWRGKLARLAQVSLPEKEIENRIRAGVLHLDINSIGKEPDGPVGACVGSYSPIGSESAPMIQFYDAMGWHDLAERCLDFFFARQADDGFIQTFGGYQLETGPTLWTAGEHYRYTRDEKWVRRITPNLVKGCDYLLRWRDKNKREELRGKGYGLLNGKVADPNDFFHSFMLNALSYLGIQRVAETLAKAAPAESKRLAKEAAAFRRDIRTAYFESVGRSPVVPLGDGSWVPSAPPWSEYPGPLSLFAEGGSWYSHGAVHARDSLTGPLYLVMGEVLDPGELAATFLLQHHQELFTLRNAAYSQPYYSRHDFAHAKRGEVKAFLKTYYNQFAAIQDRETLTFWEHYFYASEHKTHEEGWFLMQTRWMLYQENGDSLSILPLIPRRWMENGKRIQLTNWATYFGPVSVSVESKLDQRVIEAVVTCDSAHSPKELLIRLPHPLAQRASSVEGGEYDPASETIRVKKFKKAATVAARFE